jgi:hypothetical protein
MLGLRRYRQTEVCPRCGGPKIVCQSPDAENAFESPPPTRCHVSTAIMRAQDAFMASNHSPQEQALVWGARTRPGKEADHG